MGKKLSKTRKHHSKNSTTEKCKFPCLKDPLNTQHSLLGKKIPMTGHQSKNFSMPKIKRRFKNFQKEKKRHHFVKGSRCIKGKKKETNKKNSEWENAMKKCLPNSEQTQNSLPGKTINHK